MHIAYFVVPKAVLDVLDGSRAIYLVTEIELAVENEKILLLE